MPDLLTHVLVGYVLGTLLTINSETGRQLTTVVMLGAILPDLTKIKLVIPDALVESTLGIPFSWYALHTLGGVLITTTVGALFVEEPRRRQVFVLLLGGAFSHLILDSLLIKPSGYANLVWWPFITTALPTPGLYLSSDHWPAILTGFLALSLYLWKQH